MLINTYIEMMLSIPGHTKTSVAEGLADHFGRKYTINVLNSWIYRAENPDAGKPLPRDVAHYMMQACINHAIQACNGTPPFEDEDSDRLVEMLLY